MKYLHIMNYSNYVVSKSFTSFVGDFFDAKEHVFAFVGKFDDRFEEISSQCKIIHLKRSEELIPYMKEAELVLLHALTFNAKMQMISLLNPSIMRKIVWIAWGGDLYQKEKKRNLKNSITVAIKKEFIRNLRFFVSIFDPDASYFKENYKSKAKVFNSSYVGGCYLDLYKKDFEYIDIVEKYKRGESINILIGHQANPELNHLRVLKQLQPYKNENIKIYIPMNYGDKSNSQAVEACAKELYGEKAVILKEWMSLDEYDKLLADIDIAVFDTTRQIGLGNINKLIYMQKKLFMFPNSVMYNYYTSNKVCIYDCTTIGKISFIDFISNTNSASGVEFIKERLLNKERKIEQWRSIFLLACESENRGIKNDTEH